MKTIKEYRLMKLKQGVSVSALRHLGAGHFLAVRAALCVGCLSASLASTHWKSTVPSQLPYP